MTNAIKETLSQLRTIPNTTKNIEAESESELELITQEFQPNKENIADIYVDKEPRKRKRQPTHKPIDGTPVITPIRSSRQQEITRNQEAAIQNTQK